VNDRAAYANADARLLPLPDKSVHMIATSPPYWGLRSYATGDNKHAELGAEPLHDCLAWARGEEPCGACYVCNMRTWAREMHRVLRDDGCMFLNLADSYASSGRAGPVSDKATWHGGGDYDAFPLGRAPTPPGLKPKDLCGIPQRVVLALQADGWYWRSEIIWHKPNAMPSSVKDRPSTDHEYVFLLTKRARYFWDAEAVKEKAISTGYEDLVLQSNRPGWSGNPNIHGEKGHSVPGTWQTERTRNLRTVWTIATAPYAGSHFATWPPALVERMVKAGTSERGVCPTCGAPWRRVVEKSEPVNAPRNPNDVQPYPAGNGYNNGTGATTLHKVRHVETVEWRPTCAHADASPIPAIVLDPFCGSGTTLLVARQLGRVGLGFDLSETYLRDNAAVRLGHDKLAAWGRGIVDTGDYADLFRAHANGNGNGVNHE
jgi:DNA modification methylase